MRGLTIKQRAAQLAAASLVGAVGLGAIGVAPASAALPPAQNTTSFCTNTPPGFGGFTDTGTTIHRRPIECMAFASVAAGKAPGRFAPGDPVTRGQMASFIARAIDVANELELVPLPSLPSSPPDRFADDDNDVHEANIDRLAAANIVSGTSASSFSPGSPVTRAQMATFINNAQTFLSGGAATFTAREDYFVDDNTSPHQANINGIASVGITQGLDRVSYGPSANVERANMATFIARYLAVLHAAGAIDELAADDSEPPPPPPPASNATIGFTPTNQARLVAAVEPSDADDRVYTATGLQARPYRVELFDLSKLTIDPGPVYTFTEAGNSGIADPGSVGGRIVKVNGIATSPAQSVGAVTPVNGQIVVSVDAVSFGRLLPVIYTDEGGANATSLNLDDVNRPIEPFGVGGLLETIPPDSATLAALGNDQTVLFNDEAANLIVTQGASASDQRSFRYDDNDKYYIDSVSVPNELTPAEFELRLSTGDKLDADSSYNANPALPSTFILQNVSPAPPTPCVTSVGETSAVITVNDLLPGATAIVYLGPDNASFAGTTAKTSSSVDGNPGEPGFQVNLGDLTPSTSYEFYVTQRSEGEESKPLFTSATPAGATCATTQLVTTATVAPFVTAAAVNGGRAGSTTNQVNVDFSEAVTAEAGAPAKLTVVCTKEVPGILPIPILFPPTIQTTFSGAGTAVTTVDANTLRFTMAGNIPNDGSVCKAALAAGAVKDTTGQLNSAQSNITVS